MSYYTKYFDENVVELLINGGAGFMPSDTIYGLSALASNEWAVEKIHLLKDRNKSKPFIVLLANVDQASELGVKDEVLNPVKKYWPAPLTFVCEAPDSPGYLHLGKKTLAIRVPDEEKLRSLILKTGPLISTSANLQGEKVVKNIAEAEMIFGENLDFYVDSGEMNGEPSTIITMQNGRLKVLRQGKFNKF